MLGPQFGNSFRGRNFATSAGRFSLQKSVSASPNYPHSAHGIPKCTAFMSIPFFSRDLISESLDPASGSPKGILSHDAPLTRANELPSRPGCPDAARSRQLREIPRCATLPGEHLPGYQGDAFWC